jgi:uncharacterized protein (DUF488 family)
LGAFVDVRCFPASRRHSHFAREPLAQSLEAAGVAYQWVEALDGRRRRVAGSQHTAWREPGFAGDADHLDTLEFFGAARSLLTAARHRRTALMCAEALPERCHRRLIADWLTVQGATVHHLQGPRRTRAHALPPFARVEGERLIYADAQATLPL